MYTALILLQVVVAIALVALVLLQQGKGADAGAAFGSGASATVFGSRGSASFLSRATAFLAAVFFLNSLALSTPLVVGRKHAPVSVTQQVPASGSGKSANNGPAGGKPAPAKQPARPSGQNGGGGAANGQKAPGEPADVPSVPAGKSDSSSTGGNNDLPPQ